MKDVAHHKLELKLSKMLSSDTERLKLISMVIKKSRLRSMAMLNIYILYTISQSAKNSNRVKLK